jgi:hypothetical protein
VSPHAAVPLASPGPLAAAISIVGLVELFAWIVGASGRTPLRVTSWSW